MLNKVVTFLNSGQARSVRAKKNIAGMFLLKGLSILMSLLVVPLTIGYVSSYQYGIWVTISSLVAWLSFFDIGLGNGLRNRFIEAISTGNHKLAKIYVSTTYAILGIIIGAIWIIACLCSYYVDWSKLLNVSKGLDEDLFWTIIIVITNFCFSFLLRINCTLLSAIQRPAFAAVFDTVSQVLLSVIILVLILTTKGSLVYLALAMGGSSLFVLLVGNIWNYTHELSQYIPSFHRIDFSKAKDIMSLGFQFFFLQIIAIVCYQTNNLIITRWLGPEEVTVYNIAYKYVSILAMLYTIILTPFWSAFVEARSTGDYVWMKKATNRLRQIFWGTVGLGGLLVSISPWFYNFWIGDSVKISLLVTLLMFIYQIANIWGTLHTQLLFGLGKIKLQLICSTICGGVFLPMTIGLCKLWGMNGVLLSNIIVSLLFGSWFGYIQVNKLLNKKASGIWNE